jgi:hypothetical protein
MAMCDMRGDGWTDGLMDKWSPEQHLRNATRNYARAETVPTHSFLLAWFAVC